MAFRRALAMSINIDQIVTADYGNIVAEGEPDRPAADLEQVDRQGPGRRSWASSTTSPGAKALLAANGYKDTNGDGYVENKAGQSVNLQADRPERLVGLDDRDPDHRRQREGRRASRSRPAYPDYNGLVDERNSGKFDLVINNDKQLGPTPYTYYDYLFHLPIADSQTFANYSRFTAAGPKPWALTLALNKVNPDQRGDGEGDPLEDPEVHPRGSACDPALVQRHVVAVQHDVLDELPDVHRHGAAEHASRRGTATST